VTLPSGVDADRLHQDALARGVAYTRGEVFHWDGRGAGHLALSFARLDEDAIADGIARLGAALRVQRMPARARAGARGRRRSHAVG
jgi:DNA-binding transcriptional MocR family regulator